MLRSRATPPAALESNSKYGYERQFWQHAPRECQAEWARSLSPESEREPNLARRDAPRSTARQRHGNDKVRGLGRLLYLRTPHFTQ